MSDSMTDFKAELKRRLEESERDGQTWMFSYKQVMSNGERVIAERDRYREALEAIEAMRPDEATYEAPRVAREALEGK